jgi:hypothetical protein
MAMMPLPEHQPGNEADAPDVFISIFSTESQPFGQMFSHFIAVQPFDACSLRSQPSFQKERNGRLPSS